MGKVSYDISKKRKFEEEKKQNGNSITTEKSEAGKFRTILPQILASTAKNLLLIDLGLSVAFPTIVIPALRSTVETSGYVETLRFTDVQASWFGSIAFICQPLGSVLSGWVSEPLGRKRAMIVVNIPHIIAWILLHYANSIEVMYIGAILLGLGVGFMEAPIMTYVGEISQPSIRGVLISCAAVASTLGIFMIYLLGSVLDWRTVALTCLSVPLFTVVAICFVPETPMWLLSKGRKDEALKSLQWLRGWVSPKAVEKEFAEMQRYNEHSNKCTKCQKANVPCTHPPPTLTQKFKELKRKRTMKVFFLVLTLFAIGQFSGISSMRPFMVQIFKAYKVPMDPNWATVTIGTTSLLANIVCVSVVKIIGKRKIFLIGLVGSLICCIALGTYAQIVFPKGYNSFETMEDENIPTSYFPLIAFMFLGFWTVGCVTSIPWMLLSEIFPFKSRGLATGIAAAVNYIFGFISTKTYLNFDKGLCLNGVMWFYTVINLIGLFYVYLLLPETENRTLEDIEVHFSDNSRKLTDINIEKVGAITRKRSFENIKNNISTLDGVKKEEIAIPTISQNLELGFDNRAYVEN